MANGLAVWLVSFQLFKGGPVVVEEMIFDRDEGCTDWCVAYQQNAAPWAKRNNLRPANSCGCSTTRECTTPGCVAEKLKSNLKGEL